MLKRRGWGMSERWEGLNMSGGACPREGWVCPDGVGGMSRRGWIYTRGGYTMEPGIPKDVPILWDLGYPPTPTPRYWHIVAATKTRTVAQRTACILLECFLVFIYRWRSIVVCRCAQLGLQAGDNDGGQRSFVRVQCWGLALVKYLRFCDFLKLLKKQQQGNIW